MNRQNTSMFAAALLILFAALTRLFPHYPNFTAIGAMAIFAGTTVADKKMAFLFPLAAMFFADVCLELFTSVKGFYGYGQLFVYGAFMLITWLSTYIRKKNVASIGFAAIWSGIIFFILSNFGEWLFSPVNLYPHTFAGLIEGYVAAIPFYKGELFGSFFLNTIFGNLFFSALLFGSYYLITRGLKQDKVYA
ncbi:hypothetical protein EXU57_13005 [Segetibacter sp. 3557_3]|uniref:DUF6580 family putative transport protein n=1 Tax=Segetibacter sp. 3557_3 TaxID=2547429 RepID=UPI001058659E|nr:DUF6580 family putative transport protein [Segetibacter sp. 3557_3]TDH25617.1 hypothetical protein EXU57_13005 [Segetibacter sp. 3557_3]